MYSLPAPIVLRAQKERVVVNPEDVMYEGGVLQRLGSPIPDEFIERCARDKVTIYTDDVGQWCAEPLK